MIRRDNCCFIIAMALTFSIALFAQRLDKEGRVWLAANSQPAAVNVDGGWQSDDWGIVVLVQAQGNREVTGSGDGWDITGVVSGNKVFLLFSDNGRINYSAELTLQNEKMLAGTYARGLMAPKSKTKPMLLTK